MEILELITSSFHDISITDIMHHTRIKHSKAKQLLESMEASHWIESKFSKNQDLRYKDVFIILNDGEEVLHVYQEKLLKLFSFLAKK
jgi:DNA-binding PadR family transcriptional regulator